MACSQLVDNTSTRPTPPTKREKPTGTSAVRGINNRRGSALTSSSKVKRETIWWSHTVPGVSKHQVPLAKRGSLASQLLSNNYYCNFVTNFFLSSCPLIISLIATGWRFSSSSYKYTFFPNLTTAHCGDFLTFKRDHLSIDYSDFPTR